MFRSATDAPYLSGAKTYDGSGIEVNNTSIKDSPNDIFWGYYPMAGTTLKTTSYRYWNLFTALVFAAFLYFAVFQPVHELTKTLKETNFILQKDK